MDYISAYNLVLKIISWRTITVNEDDLIRIFKEVLVINEVSLDDDFFLLGGSSLFIPQLIYRIWDKTGVMLDASDIFNLRTPRKIISEIRCKFENGKIIDKSQMDFDTSVTKIADSKTLAPYPQRHIWLSEKMKASNKVYNVAFKILIEGPLLKEKLCSAIRQAMKSNEVYNVYFELERGELVVKHGLFEPKIIFKNFEGQEVDTLNKEIETEVLEKQFDLDKGPLYEIKLYKVEAEKHILLFLFHHIVIDQASIPLLWKEIVSNYNSELDEKKILCKTTDYYTHTTRWEDLIKDKSFEPKIEYWKNEFANFNTEENRFLTASDTMTSDDNHYLREKFIINKEQYNLKPTGKSDFSINTIILTAFCATIQEIFFDRNPVNNFVIGLPYANRTSIYDANIQGLFVNMLPLKLKVPFRAATNSAAHIQEKLQKLYLNQDIPYEMILDGIPFKSYYDRNNFIQFAFVYQKNIILQNLNKKIKCKYEEINVVPPMFGLTFYATDFEDHLECTLEYNLYWKNAYNMYDFKYLFKKNIITNLNLKGVI